MSSRIADHNTFLDLHYFTFLQYGCISLDRRERNEANRVVGGKRTPT